MAALAVIVPDVAGGSNPSPTSLRPDRVDNCQQGLHSLRDYTVYARKVYKRKTVKDKAQDRMRYIRQCQRSGWGERWAARFHRRFKREREARALAARVFPVSAHLRAIALCESGGNPRAISAGGTYRGKYQFSFATWASVGGRGDPAQASEAEQDRRAAMLYARDGPGQWPVCGR